MRYLIIIHLYAWNKSQDDGLEGGKATHINTINGLLNTVNPTHKKVYIAESICLF